MSEADPLEITLLGGFAIAPGPLPPVLRAPRLQSLLAYLIVHRATPVQRAALAFRLWPDSTERQALTNLRQALHYVRRGAPRVADCLRVTARDVHWAPDAAAEVDLITFETEAAEALASDDRTLLDSAAARYRGDLLPDCFGEWVGEERTRLRALEARVLERAAYGAERAGDVAAVVHHLETLLQRSPSREGRPSLAGAHDIAAGIALAPCGPTRLAARCWLSSVSRRARRRMPCTRTRRSTSLRSLPARGRLRARWWGVMPSGRCCPMSPGVSARVVAAS